MRHFRGLGRCKARNSVGTPLVLRTVVRRKRDLSGQPKCVDPLLSCRVSQKLILDLYQAVCVSACGNFGIASSSTGQIYMWNMQSGIKRKEFSIGVCPDEAANRFKPSGLKKATERSITGIASDALNRLLIASTLDGTINVGSVEISNIRLLNISPVLRLPHYATGEYIGFTFQCCFYRFASRQWITSGCL